MGLSGGSTSRQGSGQKWAAPLAQAAAGTAKDIFNSSQAGLGKITDTVQAITGRPARAIDEFARDWAAGRA